MWIINFHCSSSGSSSFIFIHPLLRQFNIHSNRKKRMRVLLTQWRPQIEVKTALVFAVLQTVRFRIDESLLFMWSDQPSWGHDWNATVNGTHQFIGAEKFLAHQYGTLRRTIDRFAAHRRYFLNRPLKPFTLHGHFCEHDAVHRTDGDAWRPTGRFASTSNRAGAFSVMSGLTARCQVGQRQIGRWCGH